MIGRLLQVLINAFINGFRILRAYVVRSFQTLWTKILQMTQISRGANDLLNTLTKNAAQLGREPSKREDFFETRRMFISRSLVIRIILILVLAILLIYFVIYPLMMRFFFTAHLVDRDKRLTNYTGNVVVYYDQKKKTPHYEGYLKEGKLQGEGTQYDQNGVLVYSGQFKDGVRSGQGEEYDDGELIYKGEFAEDQYNGKGELYSGGSLTHSGTFERGVLNGSDCTAYYSNGIQSYRGTYENGIQTGEGIAYDRNGVQCYVGSFLNGQWTGQGTLYDSNGKTVYTGEFKNGNFEGEGTLYLENGFRMKSTFYEGVQGGDATLSQKGVVYYEGAATEGQAFGQGTVFDRLGNTVYEGTMRGGTIDGDSILGKSLEDVTAMLGDCRITTESQMYGTLLTAEPLGLRVYFTYCATEKDKPTAFDVTLCRENGGDTGLEYVLWSFADNIDLWRYSMWPYQEGIGGEAIPRFSAQTYGGAKYPCVIYQDTHGTCTIWSQSGSCFMLQWSNADGQVLTTQQNAYVAPKEPEA